MMSRLAPENFLVRIGAREPKSRVVSVEGGNAIDVNGGESEPWGRKTE
jgi:hypothetical protein